MSSDNPIFYYYNPSLPGAIVITCLFSILTLYLTVQLVRYRAWFTLPLVIGGVLEIVGYVSRAISHNNTEALGPYIVESIAILVAPTLFAATIYMILARIIRLLNAGNLSVIRVNFLTLIFVLADIFCFSVQSFGAQLQTKEDKDKQRFGRILIIAALGLQIVVFSLFVVVAVIFNLRYHRQTSQNMNSNLCWQRHLTALYSASGLVLIRNIVRTIEYIQGIAGYIGKHEAFLYAFDAAPMVLVLLVTSVVYAPAVLRQGQKQNDEMDMRRLGPGHAPGNQVPLGAEMA